MPVIARFRVTIDGFSGGPGLNTLYGLDVAQGTPTGSDLDEFSTQLQSMYDDLKTYAPVGLSWSIQQEVDVLEVSDATLLDRPVLSSQWTVNGTGAGRDVSRATQAKFRYRTDRIDNNRFVQGGIFFGPLASAAMTDQGQISATFATAVTNAHNGLLDVLGPMRLAVYSVPAPEASDGNFGYVQSVSVAPRPAVLRTRRD